MTPKTSCLLSQGPGSWHEAPLFHPWNYDPPKSRPRGKCGSRHVVRPRFDFERCPLQHASVKQLCEALQPAKSLIFVGDSTMHLLYVNVAMQLSPWLASTATLGTQKPDGRRKSHTVCGGAVKLRFLREDLLTVSAKKPPADLVGYRYEISDSRGQWVNELEQEGSAVLVVGGGGLHVWPLPFQLVELNAVAKRLLAAKACMQFLRVIHVAPVAGAPHCDDPAVRPLRSLDATAEPLAARMYAQPSARNGTPPNYKDAPYPFFWHLINSWRPHFADAFRDLGAAQLDAHTIGDLRPDLRWGSASINCSRRHLRRSRTQAENAATCRYVDCGHFCPDEPVVMTIGLTLLNMIGAWGLLDPRPVAGAMLPSPLTSTSAAPSSTRVSLLLLGDSRSRWIHHHLLPQVCNRTLRCRGMPMRCPSANHLKARMDGALNWRAGGGNTCENSSLVDFSYYVHYGVGEAPYLNNPNTWHRRNDFLNASLSSTAMTIEAARRHIVAAGRAPAVVVLSSFLWDLWRLGHVNVSDAQAFKSRAMHTSEVDAFLIDYCANLTRLAIAVRTELRPADALLLVADFSCVPYDRQGRLYTLNARCPSVAPLAAACVRRVGAMLSLPVIDLAADFAGREHLFVKQEASYGIHPTSAGACVAWQALQRAEPRLAVTSNGGGLACDRSQPKSLRVRDLIRH